MCAWMSTAGSEASPETAGTPRLAQLFDELAVLLGDDERARRCSVSASAMRRPTRP